jgi:hypothetical protein
MRILDFKILHLENWSMALFDAVHSQPFTLQQAIHAIERRLPNTHVRTLGRD